MQSTLTIGSANAGCVSVSYSYFYESINSILADFRDANVETRWSCEGRNGVYGASKKPPHSEMNAAVMEIIEDGGT
jgi:hypothetical protein